jgi:hypothetical protein
LTDFYTEKTETSWFGNIRNSIFAAFFGFLLFAGAFPLELWNESRAINQERALQEGEKSVISIESRTVKPENEGKLVHITGKATTKEELRDPEFGIKVNAIKLNRTVEMYQWAEERHSESKEKIGGGTETITTYSYDPQWSNKLIDSNRFRQPLAHANPRAFEFSALSQVAKSVSLGAFALTSGIIDQLPLRPFAVPANTRVANVPAARNNKVSVEDGHFYFGAHPANPEVGDERIAFEYVPPTDCSVVAKQEQNRLVDYTASNGNKIELVQEGNVSAQDMFKKAEADNNLLTWALRVAGVGFMFSGMLLMASPIRAITNVIPFVGDLTGFGIAIFAFLASLALSLVTIAIGWIAFRPLVACSLLGGAVVLFVLLLRMRRAQGGG